MNVLHMNQPRYEGVDIPPQVLPEKAIERTNLAVVCFAIRLSHKALSLFTSGIAQDRERSVRIG